MSNSNRSNLNSAAKDALYDFKMEAAKDFRVKTHIKLQPMIT